MRWHATVFVFVLTVSAIAAAPPKGEIPVTGTAEPLLASIDRTMLAFLQLNDVPGASVAVAHRGRIVYARGFGYADREHDEAVKPDSLFRIASISKPFTAVAVLQLAERGKLRLTDRVFDLLELKAPAEKFDPRWRKVTVLHLLHHTGGWDSDKSFDPMFVSPDIVRTFKISPPAMPADIVRYMLGHPLQFEPGSQYVYSNFGYCLLGRVIEKASGQPYENYVRNEVLAPLDIKSMRLGKTLPGKRAENEVHYYLSGKKTTSPAVMGPNPGKRVPLPYGARCLEALDSHGGWIASASDLVRFAMAFDDSAHCRILNKKSIDRMFARPEMIAGKPKESYYGCGWDIVPTGANSFHFWHAGLLDGTSTELVHRDDGVTWAVLFNGTGSGKKMPVDKIDPLMHETVDAIKVWPK
jgi:CubicO group peptidase (beta-lactamase class C family)